MLPKEDRGILTNYEATEGMTVRRGDPFVLTECSPSTQFENILSVEQRKPSTDFVPVER